MEAKTVVDRQERQNRPLNRKLLAVGVILLALGILAPAFLTVDNFGIYPTLRQAVYENEKIYVLLAALKLVALNSLRAVPHYLGAFFLAEAINDWRIKGYSALSVMIVCLTIPGVYMVIERLYQIRYDFGAPAISMVVILIIFSRIHLDFTNTGKKVMLFVLLIFSINFLDVMPALRGLPIGRGDSSVDIKIAAGFLEAEGFLQGMTAICSLLFFGVAMLMLMLVLDGDNIQRISEQKQQNERALMETRMRVLENRTYMELNHLVHDLKSPLTSIQALVGVVKLSCDSRGDSREVKYLEKIEANVERMSGMISEILYENQLRVVTTQHIVTGILSHTSAMEYAEMVRVTNDAPLAQIEVNVIRFSRAIVNLIENSFYAVNRKTGQIALRVFREEGGTHPMVCFQVKDNGVGIDREQLSMIWQKGYSTRSSSGLGLSFVEMVVQQSGGEVSVESTPGQGTAITIHLPQVTEKEG